MCVVSLEMVLVVWTEMICGVFCESSALFQGLVWCRGPAEGLSTEGSAVSLSPLFIRAESSAVVCFRLGQ